MKKIIVSAFAVSPERGSECAVGWEITKRLGAYFSVTVLVCEKTPSNKPYFSEIDNFIKENGEIKNVKYVPVAMPMRSRIYTWLHDKGLWPAFYWSYNTWQKEAFKKAVELHHNEKFDLAYQLNMIGFREPGYLWKLNIPFSWGPTNGFHSIPFSFINCFSGKDYLFQLLKHIANETQIKLAFRARMAAKKASVVWCVDDSAYKKMSQWTKNAELMQETGLNALTELSKTNKEYDGKRMLNLVCSGMITTGKAYFVVIDALLKIRDRNFHLTFLGDGPLKANLIKKSAPLNNKISWLGWVKHSEAVDRVKNADILIHTSLKEGTPHSILEAISMGVPVICHDTCGMGVVVNENNGFKIPYLNANYSTEYLLDTLNSIFENPEILNKKFRTIYQGLNDLTWDSKVERISKTIEKII